MFLTSSARSCFPREFSRIDLSLSLLNVLEERIVGIAFPGVTL